MGIYYGRDLSFGETMSVVLIAYSSNFGKSVIFFLKVIRIFIFNRRMWVGIGNSDLKRLVRWGWAMEWWGLGLDSFGVRQR